MPYKEVSPIAISRRVILNLMWAGAHQFGHIGPTCLEGVSAHLILLQNHCVCLAHPVMPYMFVCRGTGSNLNSTLRCWRIVGAEIAELEELFERKMFIFFRPEESGGVPVLEVN